MTFSELKSALSQIATAGGVQKAAKLLYDAIAAASAPVMSVFGRTGAVVAQSGDYTATQVGLGNVTNDAQTRAAIVPNTAPTGGQILVGNAGATAYAKQTVTGSGATISCSSTGVITISGIANASLTNSAITISGTSTALGGSIARDNVVMSTPANGLVNRTGANTFVAKTAPAGTVVGTTDTQTLSNKRIDPRVNSVASTSSLTINGDTTDYYHVTALAANITINAPTGTPVDGQRLTIVIADNGTSRTITWNSVFKNNGIGPTVITGTTAFKSLIHDWIWRAGINGWLLLNASESV